MASLRVKVYKLRIDNSWIDQGTGYCTYVVGSEGESDELMVRSDNDSIVLFTFKVQEKRKYQRQQGTLIVWSDEGGQDYALSFQEPEGYIENTIPHVDYQQESTEDIVLPAPEMSNLSDIATIVTGITSVQKKDCLASYIMNENYIDKLLPLFESFEDLSSTDDLHLLYTIMKAIILLNSTAIIEFIVSDGVVDGVMGILECKCICSERHHQIVTIKDEAIMTKIYQTFRIQYLKDVVLKGALNEFIAASLRSMISDNHVAIISHVQNDDELLTELFGIIQYEESDKEKKREAVHYIQQLCSLTIPTQKAYRESLYRSLAPYGLFDIFNISLNDKDVKMRAAGLSLLDSIIELDTCLVRSYIIQQTRQDTNTKHLFQVILEQFISDRDQDYKCQYATMIKTLLGLSDHMSSGVSLTSDSLSRQDQDSDGFLPVFYERYALLLLQPLLILPTETVDLSGPMKPLILSQSRTDLILYISDLLLPMVRLHGFRSKHLLFSSNCLSKVVQLYRCNRAIIKAAGLRVIKTCVELVDETYNRHIIDKNLLQSTTRLLLETHGSDNLLNSSCLSLLEFITNQSSKVLAHYVQSEFGSVLSTLTYIDTFKNLRRKYEETLGTSPLNDTEEFPPSQTKKKQRC
ncbi:component of IIS longevity pathway SMK-1-domain-containing protein [Spinellus fusiger]|nr:component of IIS longevity pathway SMK-1-domain-containing protein [Spinellus fusiger]